MSCAVFAAAGTSCIGGPGTIDVDAVFDDVGDLPPLGQVQAADVRIGRVTSIRLEGFDARVTMQIDASARLPRNSSALVRSTSLLGEQFIEIQRPEQPSREQLRDGDVIPIERTGIAATLDDVFLQLGAILQQGGFDDFAVFIDSAAEIVRGKEEQLGQVFTELRTLTGTIAGRSTEIGSAVDSLDTAFAAFAGGSDTLRRSVSSSADATQILADQQEDLNRLVDALDRFAAVSASYSSATTPASDRALKDLRPILDQLKNSAGDLDQSLAALSRFVDLWPRVIPGDYVQLDVVFTEANSPPPASIEPAGPESDPHKVGTLEEWLLRTVE
jgi:phospholipid/cholesterol/gamma-HCH transport system substrate-binding protein